MGKSPVAFEQVLSGITQNLEESSSRSKAIPELLAISGKLVVLAKEIMKCRKSVPKPMPTRTPADHSVRTVRTLRQCGVDDAELEALRQQGYLTQDDRGQGHDGYWRLRFASVSVLARSTWGGMNNSLLVFERSWRSLQSGRRLRENLFKSPSREGRPCGMPSDASPSCWRDSECITTATLSVKFAASEPSLIRTETHFFQGGFSVWTHHNRRSTMGP